MSTYEFSLPDVGEGLSEGEIVAWHVAEGDRVEADQIIVDVQTDKAIVEIPAPVSGIIVRLGGKPNDVLPVGAVLAVFETEEGPADSSPVAPGRPAVAAAPGTVAVPPSPPRTGPATGSASDAAVATVSPSAARPRRARASPATRKLARSLGVELAEIVPTGGRGQVTRGDVEAAAAARASTTAAPIAAAPAGTAGAARGQAEAPAAAAVLGPPADLEDRTEPLRGLRRQIAQTMDLAWRTVPHIFSMDDLDATALVAARRSLNADLASEGIKLSFLPFFIKACAVGLRAHPRFNASVDLSAEQIRFHARVNIGIATATPDGLIVTVVHDADRRSLVDVAIEVENLARLARERRIGLPQLSGATFSISNYGSYGAHMGTPIIRPPECAIAGFGRVADAVVPVDGVPAVRPRLPFCISADHRLNDGEDLGRFVSTMSRYLLDPVRLLGLR